MKILIQPLQKAGAQHWQVRLDNHSVTFHSEREARQFVATLENRLRAPHSWPASRQRIAS
jgi:hypothetical protein